MYIYIKIFISILVLLSFNSFAEEILITGNSVGDLVVGKAPPALDRGRLVLRTWEVDENGKSYELLKVKISASQVSAEVYDGTIWRIRVDKGTLKTREGIKIGDRVAVVFRNNPKIKPEVGPGPNLVLISSQFCGLSYVTDAELPETAALPLTLASTRKITKAARVKTIFIVGCDK